jgi:hypothetical protein
MELWTPRGDLSSHKIWRPEVGHKALDYFTEGLGQQRIIGAKIAFLCGHTKVEAQSKLSIPLNKQSTSLCSPHPKQ